MLECRDLALLLSLFWSTCFTGLYVAKSFRPAGVRIISNSELRPGDLVFAWYENDTFDMCFIVEIDRTQLYIVKYLITTCTGQVKTKIRSSSGIFTSHGVLFRDWSQFICDVA